MQFPNSSNRGVETGMNLERIEKLIELMRKYELNELQVKEGELEFSARHGEKPQPVQQVMFSGAPQQGGANPVPLPSASGINPLSSSTMLPLGTQLPPNCKEVCSPIVGTFYRSPAPDQPAFKQVGDRIQADEVICIVEAMKVMNEIKSGITGTIKKILIENASSVEFGQALFLIELG